jgi:hypothetical protein
MAFENKSYKAKVECNMLVQNSQDDPLNIVEYINTIRVDKQYFDASFPVYSFEMTVTAEVYEIIQSNDVYFNINVVLTDVLDDTDEEVKLLIDELLLPFEKPSTPVNFDDPNGTLDESETQGTTITQYPVVIHMLSKKDYDKNRFLINEVLSDVRPKEALLHIIGKASQDSSKELYVEPVDNGRRYRNILVPPMNLISAVNHIHNTYGVYENGIKLFIDGGNMYLLRRNGLLQLEDTSIQNINIIFSSENQLSSEYNGRTGLWIDDETGVTEIVTTSDPAITDTSDTNRHIAGQNIVFGKYSELFDVNRTTIKTVDDNETNLKTKYYWNNFDSPVFEQEFVNEVTETSVVLSFLWNEIDPDYFNIINRYSIETNNTFVNGLYRIQNLNYSLVSNNTGEDFDILGKSVFTKVN